MIKKASLKLGYFVVDITLYSLFWVMWHYIMIIWDGKDTASLLDTILSSLIGYCIVRPFFYYFYERPEKKKEGKDGEK